MNVDDALESAEWVQAGVVLKKQSELHKLHQRSTSFQMLVMYMDE